MEGIFASIDYYTSMFYDTKFRDVVEWVGLDFDVVCDEFFRSQRQKFACGTDQFEFHYENVDIYVKLAYLYGRVMDMSIFDIELPEIRLDLSGQGLDFMRREFANRGESFDDYLRDDSKLLPKQSVTRVDFAFDFVNYKPDLLDKLDEYIELNQTDSKRLCIRGQTSSMRYEKHIGSQHTTYIGSPQSERMLRVYDKRLQYVDAETGQYIKENDYENPDHWIRIELQTRRTWAQRLLFALYPDAEKNFLSILKEIYKMYDFADLSTPRHRRMPASFWTDIFDDWEKIGSIIQNKNVVQNYVSYGQRCFNNSGNWRSAFICCSSLSLKRLEDLQAQQLYEIQTPLGRPNEYSLIRQHQSLIGKLNECGVLEFLHSNSHGIFFYSSSGLLNVSYLRPGLSYALDFLRSLVSDGLVDSSILSLFETRFCVDLFGRY